MARYEVQSLSKTVLCWNVTCKKDGLYLSSGERIVLSEEEYNDVSTQKLLSKKLRLLRLVRQLP